MPIVRRTQIHVRPGRCRRIDGEIADRKRTVISDGTVVDGAFIGPLFSFDCLAREQIAGTPSQVESISAVWAEIKKRTVAPES